VSGIGAVLDAFRAATQCEAAVWVPAADGSLVAEAATAGAVEPPPEVFPASGDVPREWDSPGGAVLLSLLGGPRRAWLALGPCASESFSLQDNLRFLSPVAAQYLQSALEVEHAANELAERYEEINLLYTISEILGRTVALEEAAETILREISETVGARRASILVHDRVTDTLQVVAAIGVDPEAIPPIALDDDCSVSARVFRTLHSTITDSDDGRCPAESAYRRGAMLSVPILWTTPRGGEPLGVVNLSDRRSRQPFSAGDQKLIAAIATQIGTAIQNARLVRQSLSQQRLEQEMQLAHELQMRLLPDATRVAPEAIVAARVVPAESVGGDFYNLFRLGQGRTGVMIGDVSGHGYQAALIMALTMSASAIHAQSTTDPAETLKALLDSLSDELSTTEMFISSFYGVVDPGNRQLVFANAGHPHAFLFQGMSEPERLPAIDPPLGMVADLPHADRREWTPARDLLVLFTDGISDARGRSGQRLGESRVLETVSAHREQPPGEIVDAVFRLLDLHTGDVTRRDDLTLVVLRS
jgi:phosphoserine phosphatase RsbU/P